MADGEGKLDPGPRAFHGEVEMEAVEESEMDCEQLLDANGYVLYRYDWQHLPQPSSNHAWLALRWVFLGVAGWVSLFPGTAHPLEVALGGGGGRLVWVCLWQEERHSAHASCSPCIVSGSKSNSSVLWH